MNSALLDSIIDFLIVNTITLSVEAEKVRPFGVDMSIESMSSRQFSVGIFYFLVFCIIVFVVIIFMFMFKGKTTDEGGNAKVQKLKTGEKWLFVWILFGVVAAVIFGAVQMMHGFLF